MITIEDILKIKNLEFSQFEEYVGTERDKDFNIVKESYYRDYPETKEFSYGCIQKGINRPVKTYDPNTLFITSPFMTGSDYSGTTIELSNFESFKDLYQDCDGVYFAYGGYSTFCIVISVKWLLDRVNEDKANEVLETLKDLSDYPVINEDHMSNMESEKEYEYVTTDGFKYDFIREMKEQHKIEITDYTVDQAWNLYRDLMDHTNEYPLFEDNGWPYIDWEKLAKECTTEDLKKSGISFEEITS